MNKLDEIKVLAQELARQIKKNSEQILRDELSTDNLSILERSEYYRIRKLIEDADEIGREIEDLQRPRKEGKLVLRNDGRYAIKGLEDCYFTSGAYMELLIDNDPEYQYWLFGSVEYNHQSTAKLDIGYYFKKIMGSGSAINLKEGMTVAIREF
jgi:hypothetical protein